MARLTASKSLELESFWRSHLEGWRRSDLNQREYCEAHGLPLKRFGNWRAKLRHAEFVRRGGYCVGQSLRFLLSIKLKRYLIPVPDMLSYLGIPGVDDHANPGYLQAGQ